MKIIKLDRKITSFFLSLNMKLNLQQLKSIFLGLVTIGTLTVPSIAQAGIREKIFTFEGAEGWWFAGNSGLDYDKGLEHRGKGNGWVRNHTGWNAINNKVEVTPNTACSLGAWLRTSDTLTDGYMSVRAWNNDGSAGSILSEIKLAGAGNSNPVHRGYNYYKFDFNSGPNKNILLYMGLHGNGKDSWIQADDVRLTCAN